MDTIISLTNAAYEHIKKMVDEDQAIGFRLSLKKTGCSGYAYVPRIVKQQQEYDLHFILKDELHIFIDANNKEFLQDTVVDYVHDNKTGLKQKQLIFINPNEKNRCGCGESFTIE